MLAQIMNLEMYLSGLIVGRLYKKLRTVVLQLVKKVIYMDRNLTFQMC